MHRLESRGLLAACSTSSEETGLSRRLSSPKTFAAFSAKPKREIASPPVQWKRPCASLPKSFRHAFAMSSMSVGEVFWSVKTGTLLPAERLPKTQLRKVCLSFS